MDQVTHEQAQMQFKDLGKQVQHAEASLHPSPFL